MSSFKRKKYGQVKPVKHKVEKLKKPDIRELKAIYRALEKTGMHQRIDNICYAMAWWDNALIWFNTQKDLSLSHHKLIVKALNERELGCTATTDNNKKAAFMTAIAYLEKAVKEHLKVPILLESIKIAQVADRKIQEKSNSLTPRFQKLIDMLHGMFAGKLLMEVVPTIVNPFGGKELERKFDHELGTIYYSKECAKSLQRLLIKEGVMALAIQEAYHWSKALAMKDETKMHRIFAVDWADAYTELMTDFRLWAKNPKSPKTLIKRPKKKKKEVLPLESLDSAFARANAEIHSEESLEV